MTNICNFDGIYWKSPVERWLMEAFCEHGGTLVMLLVVLVFLIYILIKVFEDR